MSRRTVLLMKKLTRAAALLGLAAWTNGAAAQVALPTGTWQGQLGVRRVVLVLQPDSSFLALPDDGNARRLVPAPRRVGDSVVAALDRRTGLRGRLSADGRTLTSTLTYYAAPQPVVLTRVPAVQPLVLAQAPRLPLPYRAEEVQFALPDGSIRFGGTLTHPAGPRRVPAVLLLSGTGPQNRNGASGSAGHQPFEVLADYLTRRGIAVLRTDDRGVGQTTGLYATATTADFAHDAEAAVRYLRGRPDIDPAQVGVLGHSEGGAAALLAAAEDPRIAFVVSLSGLLSTGLQALTYQNAALVNASPLIDRAKGRANAINGLMFRTAYDYADSPELEARLRATYQAWKTQDDARQLADQAPDDHFRFPLDSYVRQATGPWYRYHVRFDPAPLLARVKVPVLALNGDRDVLVDYHQLTAVAAALRANGNPDVTTRVMPGDNHLLQPCRTCLGTEYRDLPTTLDPAVLQTVGDWLAAHTRTRN